MNRYAGAAPASNHCGQHVSAAQHQRFENMLKRAENRVCFDCGARQPRWASTNLGIFFCLRCAGIHRSLGVHISKVKSTNMDAWEESMIDFIEHVGNARGRLLYECNMPETAKPRPTSETGVVERILRAKYERKEYYNPKFNELLAEFMQTPITDGENGLIGAAAKAKAEEEALRLHQRQQLEERQRAEAQRAAAAAAAAQLEELWGAPISTSAAVSAVPTVREEVAELFATPVSAGFPSQRSDNPFWGMAVPCDRNNHPQPLQPQGFYAPRTNSAGSSVGLPTGSPLGGLFPSPASMQPDALPSSCVTSRQSSGFPVQQNTTSNNNNNSNGAGINPYAHHNSGHSVSPVTPAQRGTDFADELFASSSTPAQPPPGPKDEILSLFSSALPVGSYGGDYGQQLPQMNRHPNAAWQPHVVRPYYYPEK